MSDFLKQLSEYRSRLMNEIPVSLLEGALSIFCIGLFVFVGWKGFRKGIRFSAALLLVEYAVLLLCSTVLFRKTSEDYEYDWRPFWSYKAIEEGRGELLPEIIMNVVAFALIGLLLCLAFRTIRWWQVLFVGWLISFSIEVMQLGLKRGFAEVDDVMHNTLGCIMGYGFFKIVSQICHNERKRNESDRRSKTGYIRDIE